MEIYFSVSQAVKLETVLKYISIKEQFFTILNPDSVTGLNILVLFASSHPTYRNQNAELKLKIKGTQKV